MTSAGRVRPYTDYEAEVQECAECECRFVDHDGAVYDLMHRAPSSSYASHERLAADVSAAFRRGDVAGLRAELSRSEKFRFIIDSIDAMSGAARILEMGCSKGYLGAYFIAAGRDYTGVDVSATAIDVATRLFGQHFMVGEPREGLSYDVIYHVGTIGCVESPIRFTRALLSRLRPRGTLLFNAPNVAAARERKTAWIPATPPPDLVTLFSERFWEAQFSDAALVRVTCVRADPIDVLRWRLAVGRRASERPARLSVLGEGVIPPSRTSSKKAVRSTVRPAVAGLARTLQRLHALPQLTSEFGMYVTMIKR